MNCLTFSATRCGTPMTATAQRVTPAMKVTAGLVCTPENMTVQMVSQDSYQLVSNDKLILYGRQN